jgi:uncharacterized protein VirK/YbjX
MTRSGHRRLATLGNLYRKARREGIPIALRYARNFFADEPLCSVLLGLTATRRMFGAAQIASIVKSYPNLSMKYLDFYMAKSFGKVVRRTIMLHHYSFIMRHFPEDFYKTIDNRYVVLWGDRSAGSQNEIALSFNWRSHFEGDLTLAFLSDGNSIFETSFVILPGRVIGISVKDVLCIGRVQGGKGELDAIKAATRFCDDISPPHLLMAAIEGFASALSVAVVAGVSDDEQVSKWHTKKDIAFAYDDFWKIYYGNRTRKDFFEMPVPLPLKPIREVTRSHRRRARHKQRFKQRVSLEVQKELERVFALHSATYTKVPAVSSPRFASAVPRMPAG